MLAGFSFDSVSFSPVTRDEILVSGRNKLSSVSSYRLGCQGPTPRDLYVYLGTSLGIVRVGMFLCTEYKLYGMCL